MPNSNADAFFAGPDSTTNSDWLFDSGATNHVTADPSNLQHRAEYNGSDKLVIGNGQGLPISRIGSSTISSNCGALNWKNILHVLQITKNL